MKLIPSYDRTPSVSYLFEYFLLLNVNNSKLAIEAAFGMVDRSSFPTMVLQKTFFCFFWSGFVEIVGYGLD